METHRIYVNRHNKNIIINQYLFSSIQKIFFFFIFHQWVTIFLIGFYLKLIVNDDDWLL